MSNNHINIDEVVGAIRSVVHTEDSFIALHEPLFSGNEWNYVKECIDTGWISSVGKFVDAFEESIKTYTGAKYAVATVNGTAALHLSLKLLDVQQGDEVLVPSLTFVATANSVSYTGAVPHFIDCEELTLGIDVDKLRVYLEQHAVRIDSLLINKSTKRPIKALIAMHTFGHPVDLDPLVALCEEYGLFLIEDAAESLGSYYKGIHTGLRGTLGSLSFNGNKIITTGGGGAIITNDEHLANRAKHLSTTAKMPHRYEYIHDEVGFNYRLPNINAALGCAQMERLESFVEQKRKLALHYLEAFQSVQGAAIFREQGYARSNYWLNTLILNEGYEHERDRLLDELNHRGMMSRPIWRPLHTLPMFRDCPRMDLSGTIKLEQTVINLPSSVKLGGAL
jgi:perosamine synthetase